MADDWPAASVGVFFGPTPSGIQIATSRSSATAGSGTVPAGRVHISAVRGRAARVHLWLDADRQRGDERLVCAVAGCGSETDATTLPLTRERMRQTPPDILFTSTES